MNVFNMIKTYKIFYSTEDFENAIKFQVFLPKYVKHENFTKIYKNVEIPEVYVTCWNENNLIGCLKQLCVSTYEYKDYYKNHLSTFYDRTIMYISISDEFKNKGIGTTLIEKYFNVYKEHNLFDTVVLSPFSVEGFNYIRKKLLNLAYMSNIPIKDSYCFE